MSHTSRAQAQTTAPSTDDRAALVAAVDLARAAPSVHNTQPWRWRLESGRLGLRVDRRRRLRVADREGRLLMQSCGAALHHARLALAAAGRRVNVERLPDPHDPELLATVGLTGFQDPDMEAAALVSVVSLRRTDRRPVTERSVEPASLDAIRAAAEGEATELHMIRREDIVELTVAMAEADQYQVDDAAHRAEIATWIGGDRPDRTGVPSNVIPDAPTQTRVRTGYFGPPGTLPADGGHDANATFAILHGDTDGPHAWLRAGEALSACWLTATRLQVSVLPISAVVEVTSTRVTLARMLSDLGYPYVAMRLGHADSGAHLPPATPRLAVEDIIEEPHD